MQRAHIATSILCQCVKFHCRHIGHGVHFRMCPDIFNRVEFRSIGRKEVDMQSCIGAKQFLYFLGAMRLKTVPHDNDMPRQFLHEAAKESYDSGCIDIGIRMQAKIHAEQVSPGSDAESPDNRNFFMRTGSLIQNRSLTARTPGSPYQWSHQHAAFIDKNDMRFQFGSFFLMRGQSTLTHSLILVSFRSMARRSGFWGLHPRS